MKVAIVSAYHGEPLEWINQCIESVKSQTHKECTHIMVADGRPRSDISPHVQHVVLPTAHADYGDTPRLIGAVTAFAQGFDALCWLDADNWFEPNHVETLLGKLDLDTKVVTATRKLWNPETNQPLGVCHESDGETFNDTNCYLLTREAMYLAVRWGFKPHEMSIIGDRHVWAAAKKLPRKHSTDATVNYRTLIAGHYLERGIEPPRDAKVIMRTSTEEPFRTVLYREII